ncbi:MAG: DUF5615 family PIN-like protein [Candidatus Bathyarchaeia archaeon]|jgi:hypothetical protein
MKFLADENIPLEAVNTLSTQGLDIISIVTSRRGLSDLEDRLVEIFTSFPILQEINRVLEYEHHH